MLSPFQLDDSITSSAFYTSALTKIQNSSQTQKVWVTILTWVAVESTVIGTDYRLLVHRFRTITQS
uniref:Uncharacterized protein n=1 Tax=Arion vulgaris TaxID=1028688 RepID=A0A0B7B1M2_9EUPU